MESTLSADTNQSASAIAGALAHELNNPLQGIISLLSVLGRECIDDQNCQLRVAQIRSGLTRLSRIIASFSIAYENLPRPADHVRTGEFIDQLSAAMAERQLKVDSLVTISADTPFFCHGPELIQLISDAFSVPSLPDRTIRLRTELGTNHIVITCQRETVGSRSDDVWHPLDRHRSVSGLAVLIDEVIRLGNGKAEFHFDETALDGVRLYFSVLM
ncbi:MAG: histidine kinase dimerization/phospho-acceptor domain-containing protein [Calditrichota bacterium]